MSHGYTPEQAAAIVLAAWEYRQSVVAIHGDTAQSLARGIETVGHAQAWLLRVTRDPLAVRWPIAHPNRWREGSRRIRVSETEPSDDPTQYPI